MQEYIQSIREFLKFEAAGGILLMGASALALVVANSPLSGFYQAFLDLPVAVQVGALSLDKPLLLWINDGLMAVFFLLIGLELKREMMTGELRSRDQILLPAVAAAGGFAVPAAIYVWINWDHGNALNGWAIPAATDIAFALGVLALLGKRVPLGLKVFLTSVAIFDDLAAIVTIAVFYTADLSWSSLALAAVFGMALLILNRRGVTSRAAYVLVGIALWVCVLKSGVHATVAGICVGLAIPFTDPRDPENSPAGETEHELHPWVAYAILPLFAFANAGVDFSGVGLDGLLHPVPLGIALGLFIGKQVGVFGAVLLLVKTGLARLPQGADLGLMYGVALLTGIGFTMSLFIGTLAFEHGDFDYAAGVRLGVFLGSMLAALAGYALIRLRLRRLGST